MNIIRIKLFIYSSFFDLTFFFVFLLFFFSVLTSVIILPLFSCLLHILYIYTVRAFIPHVKFFNFILYSMLLFLLIMFISFYFLNFNHWHIHDFYFELIIMSILYILLLLFCTNHYLFSVLIAFITLLMTGIEKVFSCISFILCEWNEI